MAVRPDGTVVHPESGRVTASFAAVAKHYGVSVRPCPPRRGNCKGVVEKANHVAAQRFWRTLPDDITPEQAQQILDTWCARRGDIRLRATTGGKATVATIAAREPLRPAPPAPFPAILSVPRTVSAQALVAFRGNRYSVAPELARAAVLVRCRLGAGYLDIATTAGTVIARHALAPAGAGVMVRDHGHVLALEQAAMTAASPAAPHRRKQRIPPGPAALAAANAVRATAQPATGDGVIDLARYAAAARAPDSTTPLPSRSASWEAPSASSADAWTRRWS